MIMSNDAHTKQTEATNDTHKRQRRRSVFDFEQIRRLEYVFDQITHYPDLSLRQQLTRLTDLPDKKVQVRSPLKSSSFIVSRLDLVSKSSCEVA